MRIALLSDTHLPARGRALPPELVRECREADLILHCGDITTASTLGELELLGEVRAVAGNCDDSELGRRLPERLVLDVAGVRVGMVHDGGARRGRSARLEAAFPDCDVVAFGHSHQPLVSRSPRGLLLLNPGSACDRRREPVCTMLRLQLEDGVLELTRIELPTS